MEIKQKINDIINKLKGDASLKKDFEKNPVQTVEKLLNVDLPDEQLKQIADGVKANLDLSSVGDKLGGLFGKK